MDMINLFVNYEQLEDLLRCISHQMYHLERLYNDDKKLDKSHEYNNLAIMYCSFEQKLYAYLIGEEV